MKRILTILFLFLTHYVNAQRCLGDSNFIEWDSFKKISISYFHEIKICNSDSIYGAGYFPFIKNCFYVFKDSLFTRMITVFDLKKAWKKQNINDIKYLENHEQIHFDITEIFARKIRKLILARKLNEKEIEIVFSENIKACNDFQNQYDIETNHSINQAKQIVWDKRIKELLLSLEMFKEQPIYIKQPICKICWAHTSAEMPPYGAEMRTLPQK